MPKWLHERAKHILAENPDMPVSEAFGIATNQSHALGKTPKSYGTSEGRAKAKTVYTTPSDDKKTANPGHLETPKLAVSQQWVAGKVNAAKNITGGRMDRFFGGMADTAARAGQKSQAASMMGNAARGAAMNNVSNKAMAAAETASYHPKFPMGKLSSAKEAGIKDVLMQEIPGTKPWLIGRPGLSDATSAVSKIRKPMQAAGRTAGGAWDVSAQAKQMGLHNRKMASAFAELEHIIQTKLASRFGDFIEGAKHEAGPAAGATLGAGIANAYGVDPLAGAAAGYGLGASHDIYTGIKKKMLESRLARQAVKAPLG